MNKSSNEAGARGGQLEVFNGEWEVVIIRIVDQEAVIDVLLNAFGFIAGRNQWARSASGGSVALFDTGVLVELVVVRFDFVDNYSPFSLNVDGTQRLNVSGGAWAQVRLLFDFVQSVYRVLGVDSNVLVQGQNGLVVLIQSVDHVVGRIFGVFEAPVLGRILGASGDFGLVLGFGITGLWVAVRSRLILSTDNDSYAEKDHQMVKRWHDCVP